MRVRRTRHAFLQIEPPEPMQLLRGLVEDERYALAWLTGTRVRLSSEALELLLSLSCIVMREMEEPPAELVDSGLLITDSDEPELAAIRRRDEQLTATGWNLDAAAFHLMTQWSAIDIRGDVERLELGPESRAAGHEYVKLHGPPPDPFPAPRSGSSLPLPDGERSGGLYDALMARKTSRAFATDTPMRLDDLATILRYVFGAVGSAHNVADVECIKRTSPSGGSMHPIEAYPIVTNVEGIEPGIYHYDWLRHRLEPIAALEEARVTVTRMLAGQDYFGDAHVSIVLAARFARNHWKYRRHNKAYPGMLMDAAHLSQTLYLVAAELGLGAFVTLAVNGREIDERLGLDGIEEGTLAVCGCGVRAPGTSPLELRFLPLA